MSILFDRDFSECIRADLFNPEALSEQGLLKSTAKGRGSAWFVDVCEAPCVLRHYFRGGLVGRISRDGFFWTGLRKTRAWQEWELLAWMYDQGLPVPRPLAASVERRGLFYSCDIITHEIPDAVTLADRLMESPLSEDRWLRVGNTIARVHDAGVFHSDLNARNILMTSDSGIYLIDFDKSGIRDHAGSWQEANLERLQRSFLKFLGLHEGFHFGETDWQALLEGYQAFKRDQVSV